MPVETHYVDLGQGAYKYAHGILTSTDLLLCVLTQSQDVEHTRKLKYIFYDFTDVTEARVAHDSIAQLVELNRKTAANSPGLLAAVAAPNLVLFGIARDWQSFASTLGWRIQVFRERPEAVAWLMAQLAREKITSPFLTEFPQLKAAD